MSSEGNCESDYEQSSDVDICYCLDPRKPQTDTSTLDETQSLDGDDLYTVHVGVANAEPLCVKLNDLIGRGKISKERILYRYLNDVIEIMDNPFHKYGREIVKFSSTITYLGGRRTANFIRGRKNLGDGGWGGGRGMGSTAT